MSREMKANEGPNHFMVLDAIGPRYEYSRQDKYCD
jgi:hypothetical protein